MPDFASLYWGRNHTQGKVTNFTKEHWASYIKELEETKAKTTAKVDGNGTIDNATEMVEVFGMNINVAKAIDKSKYGLDEWLCAMDTNKNGVISEWEYERFIQGSLKLNAHTGEASTMEDVERVLREYLKEPRQIDCGTGIPCNFKVYASSQHDHFSYSNLGIVGDYPKAVWEQYKVTGNFESGHQRLTQGYGDKATQDKYGDVPKATHSTTGNPWDTSVHIDHAVIFYDPNPAQPAFKNNAELAAKALEAKNPRIKIKLMPATNAADYEEGFADQAEFVNQYKGKKPNVAIFSSAHGLPNKEIQNTLGFVKYNDKGDLQGQTNGLTEAMLEAHMQELCYRITDGFVVIEACGSGAFTDADLTQKKKD